MKLFTKIISKATPQMTKQISCCFDHPFQIINNSKLQQNSNKTLSNKDITTYILQKHNNVVQANKCLIVYKMQLDIELLKQYVQKSENMIAKIYEYNPHNKQLSIKIQLPGQNHYQISCRDQITIILELQSQQNNTKVYFLPYSNRQQLKEMNRSVHQNFKFLRVINQYIKLQDNCTELIQISQPIILELKNYLYLKQIKHIQFIIWIQQDLFDMRLLDKIGQLKLPEPWLEKQQYRHKKLQIYKLKLQESHLLNNFKQNKKKFIKQINYLQQLVGNTVQQYQNINIQSLKDIKAKNPAQVIQQIKQNQQIMKNLQNKVQELSNKKKQYLQKMSKIQKSHVQTISDLKKQIISIQNSSKQNKDKMNSGLIYLKTRKQTQNHLIDTIFVHNDKKKERIKINEKKKQKNDTNQYYLFESQSTQPQLSTKRNNKPNIQSKNQYENNEKKVANVVKQIGDLKISKASLREKYQNQMIKIDFQVQIKNNDMLNKFKEASAYINKLLLQNDQLNI